MSSSGAHCTWCWGPDALLRLPEEIWNLFCRYRSLEELRRLNRVFFFLSIFVQEIVQACRQLSQRSRPALCDPPPRCPCVCARAAPSCSPRHISAAAETGSWAGSKRAPLKWTRAKRRVQLYSASCSVSRSAHGSGEKHAPAAGRQLLSTLIN